MIPTDRKEPWHDRVIKWIARHILGESWQQYRIPKEEELDDTNR